MSGLILPGIDKAPRPNRKARQAQKALGPKPVPNMQPRVRVNAPVTGCGIAMSPIGPAVIFNFADGQQSHIQLTPDQGRQTGVALISVAAQYDLLKKMEADQAADQEPVPTNPDLEQLLAEAQANTAHHGAVGLKGDEEGEVDDDDACRKPKPNSFDVNGQPCYEPPAE